MRPRKTDKTSAIPSKSLEEDRFERLWLEAVSYFSQKEIAALLTPELSKLHKLGDDQAMLPFILRLYELRNTITQLNLTNGFAEAINQRTQSPTIAPLFSRAFFLVGIRRSGNHAIVKWLTERFPPESVLYLNSADPAFFEVNGETLSVDHDKYKRVTRDPNHSVLIVSYENLDPSLIPTTYNAKIAEQADTLLLLRDLPNTAASIARGARDRPSFSYRFRVRDFPDLWCRYSRLALDPDCLMTPVLFNRWFAEKTYRIELLRALDLPSSAHSTISVASYGGGSSFDGTRYDGDASSMNVLYRWKHMQSDRLFQFLLLAEADAIHLNEQLFPMDFPPHSEWLRRWRS